MKWLQHKILCLESIFRFIFSGVYHPRFNYEQRIINIDDYHLRGENTVLLGLTFAFWPKGLIKPCERSGIEIYLKRNSDPMKVDIHLIDWVLGRSSDHFVGTINKNMDYDLTIHTNDTDPGYKHKDVKVNISPITHYSPHTIKVIMPLFNKCGFFWRS